VAVDPEMLGKVFEELVTGRHETGSYYTPKPIVAFMCREALKAYLHAQLPDEGPDSIERFVDDHHPDGLRDPEAVLEALRSVTACDPACGSGAYLLGLLHELVELRRCLFSVRQVDPVSDYRRKLEIIQRNLYGVDIDPFAVNIARLRLWLSLAIDYDGPKPEPLPNLDFKIEVGDSLTARHVGEGGQLALRQKPVEEFQKLKTTYLTAHGDDKRRLYADIQVAKKNLADLTHGGATVHGFDWPVEFAEVFADGGFDLLLANPPYVRTHRLSDTQKQILWQIYSGFKGKADLYACFIQRGIDLLKQGGIVTYICSDGWQRLDSYDVLRSYILSTCEPQLILDLRYNVFQEAKVKVSIFQFRRTVNPDLEGATVTYAPIHSTDELISFQWNHMPVNFFAESHKHMFDTSWTKESAALIAKLRALSKRGALLDVAFGLKTGDDSRWLTMEQHDQHHKLLLRGENVSRYHTEWAGEYVNYRPEMMRSHRATARPGSKDRFECEKVLVRDTSNMFQCALDGSGYYVTDVLIVRPRSQNSVDLGFVVAVLNSSLMRWYYERAFPTLHVQADEIRQLPFLVPDNASTLTAKLSELGRRRQGASGDLAVSDIEQQIDEAVFNLFGLSDNEINLVLSET
jgi:hypothetical protein